ncbi:MAG: hydrogenase small subunit [Coriobacteriia bacterium]|nr:hydrogenase small subunit [Coriobacteriia bacterium]
MTQEVLTFDDQLADHGVSRRDFLKFCGTVAAMLGLSELAVPQIAAAVEAAAASKLAPAVWLDGGLCTGCTESTAQSENPDVAQIVLDILSMNYMETIMYATGDSAEEALRQTIDASSGKFIMVYEGAVMTGFDGNALRVAGKTGLDQIKEVAPKAAAIIAVGSCAVDGGWVRAYPNPGGAMGIGEYLAQEGIKTPVINLPTCPVNPVWLVAMVIDVLLLGGLDDQGKVTQALVDKLDEFGRPKLIFGQTIHDNCPRRGHFENGEFVYQFGSEEEAKGYCLYAMGCKGPQTYTNCPIVRWNNKTSWCVNSGSPCIGCGGFNWVDENAPFLSRMRKVGLGHVGASDGGWSPATIGAVAGGVVVGALVVHGVGMGLAGRIGEGPETEEMKDYDRKRMKKGGDK